VVATGVEMVNSPTTLTRSIQAEIGISPAGKQGSVSVAGMPNIFEPRGRLWRSYDDDTGYFTEESSQRRFDPSVRMAGVGLPLGVSVERLPTMPLLPLTFPLQP